MPRELLIVVTGASGSVGGLVARELARRSVPFRALTRTPERLEGLPGVEVAAASYTRPEQLAAALDPGDWVFMVSMQSRLTGASPFTRRSWTSRRDGAWHGSSTSPSSVPGRTRPSSTRARTATEAMLGASGVPFTAVRNAMYADRIASWFDEEGRITGPGGDGRVSRTLIPELAEAIAVLLVDPAYDDRRIVTITGPQALSLSELAAVATEVTGDPYRYAPLVRDEWIAYREALGRPEWSIEAGISYYDGVARGEADVVSDDYADLTGRPPLTVREVIGAHRAEMPLA